MFWKINWIITISIPILQGIFIYIINRDIDKIRTKKEKIEKSNNLLKSTIYCLIPIYNVFIFGLLLGQLIAFIYEKHISKNT